MKACSIIVTFISHSCIYFLVITIFISNENLDFFCFKLNFHNHQLFPDPMSLSKRQWLSKSLWRLRNYFTNLMAWFYWNMQISYHESRLTALTTCGVVFATLLWAFLWLSESLVYSSARFARWVETLVLKYWEHGSCENSASWKTKRFF